ncbi:MAG: hypothetical protein FWF86_09705, partial [Clostridia bacterium]|nr:hypothetical protein [Clostridia bacterium]
MRLTKSAAVIFCLLLSGGSPGFASAGTMSAVPCIWWSVGTPKSLNGGRAEQTLTLTASPTNVIERPEVWLRIMTPDASPDGWYKGDWSSI